MTKRELTAVLVSPLAIVPTVALYSALFLRPPQFMTGMNQMTFGMMTVGVATAFGYVAAFAIGLPAHTLLARSHHRTIWAYLATWFLSALLAWACVLAAGLGLSYLNETLVDRPLVPLAFGVVWAMAGGIFWLVARPDRDQ